MGRNITSRASVLRQLRLVLATGLTACGLPLLAVPARGHGDPFLLDYSSDRNRLTVTPAIYNVFNPDENLATPGFGLPITTTYPGFSRADMLPANTTVSLRFTSPLSYWNPATGPLDPLPIASGTIKAFTTMEATITATGLSGTNPLPLAPFVGYPGEHRHVTAYELMHPDEPGLYGLWAEATATGPNYPGGTTEPSDPFLIVLNWGIQDEQQYVDGVRRLAVLPDPMITITVDSGTQTQSQAGYPLLAGTKPVVKAGAGALVLDQTNSLTESTTVRQGTLMLASASALASSRVILLTGGTLAVAPGLQVIVGGLTAELAGLVDVGRGMITVAAGFTADDVVALIDSARGDGSWNGTSGITSSAAAVEAGEGIPRTVGWLVDGATVTFAYAAPGDTNLDWCVDILDVVNFMNSERYGTGESASWSEGDFTADGVVDLLDAAGFLSTGLFGMGIYNPPVENLLAPVPEPRPALTVVLAMATTLAHQWRRRHGHHRR